MTDGNTTSPLSYYINECELVWSIMGICTKYGQNNKVAGRLGILKWRLTAMLWMAKSNVGKDYGSLQQVS